MVESPRLVATSFALIALLRSGSLHAEETDVAKADRLFREGTSALDAGRYQEACPKLEESQKLDPALGTQYNVALCRQRSGQPALAYRLFSEVASASHAAGKTEREQASQAKMAELLPHLGRLALGTSAIRSASGVEVKIAGETLPRERWGDAQIVDAGSVLVEVAAPEHEAWVSNVSVTPGAHVDVALRLGLAQVDTSGRAPPTDRSSASSSRRTIALALGGLGVVGIGVGAVFGAMAISNHSKASEVCPQPNPCNDQHASETWTDATSAGNVSTIVFIASGAVLAAGAVLWFTAPAHGARTVRLAPQVGTESAGLTLRGGFQ
jgi:hypothetical protein